VAERYAGVDWAGEKHDVLFQGADDEQVLAATFAHDEKFTPKALDDQPTSDTHSEG
jgi:hypothetical protein